VNIWINLGFSVLLELIKNRKDAEKYKKAFVKIAKLVMMTWPDEFNSGV